MFDKKSSKSVIKNVVTLDTYANKYYQYKDDAFEQLDKLTYNLSNYLVSYINNRDLISTTVSISRSIPEEDIADILDIKAYEELGLDQASNYVISSYETQNSGEEREFHIFVAEPEVLDSYYMPIKEQTKYIDLITPAPLLYKALYTKEILQDTGSHAFIYFTYSDAFITIYHNGEYLYSKSLDYSLEKIYDSYCELIGEKVNEADFFNLLEQEGLKSADDLYQKNLMKIFGEVFIGINDIIIYVKRAFEIEMIDQMYIGSVNGPIIGLDDYSQNYLGLSSSEFNFQYHIHTDAWYIDQLHYLMLLSALEYMEDSDSLLVNLTKYPRPPAFLNRASGQFIITMVAAISFSLAYPLVHLIGAYVNEATIYALSIQDETASAEAKKYKKILSEKKEVISNLDGQVQQYTDKYNSKTKTLTAIYDKKVNYRLKSGVLHNIASDLTRYGVHIEKLTSRNDTIWLSLISSSDKKITQYIHYISETHFNDLKKIDIEMIEKDHESNYYKGILKVELK